MQLIFYLKKVTILQIFVILYTYIFIFKIYEYSDLVIFQLLKYNINFYTMLYIIIYFAMILYVSFKKYWYIIHLSFFINYLLNYEITNTINLKLLNGLVYVHPFIVFFILIYFFYCLFFIKSKKICKINYLVIMINYCMLIQLLLLLICLNVFFGML